MYTSDAGLVSSSDSYWENMHSDQARILQLCPGMLKAMPMYMKMPPGEKCTFLQSLLVVCGKDLSQTLGLPPNCTQLDPTALDLDTIQNCSSRIIQLGVQLDLGVSIPQDKIGSMCEKEVFALVPAQNTPQLKGVVAAFYLFIKASYPSLFQFVELFDSEAELEALIAKPGYSRDSSIAPLVGAAVVFYAGSPHWDYAVRLNFTRMTGQNYFEQWAVATNLNTTDQFLQDFYSTPTSNAQWNPRPFNYQYMTSEALAIQLLVDEFIFQQEGQTSKPPAYKLANFPYHAYETSGFWGSIGFLFAMFMVLSLEYPIMHILRGLVEEKELKLKEGMFMMGVSPVAHVLSWWSHFLILFFCISILMTAASNTLFTYSDSSLIFWWYMLFTIAAVSYIYWISAFFSSTRTATIWGFCTFFCSIFPYYAVSGTNTSVSTKMGACILPCTCFALGTDIFAHFEDSQIGVTRTTAAQQVSGNLSFNQILGMLVVDWIIYGVLAWYCNQVIPSEWGTHRKPWFLLTLSYWCPAAAGRKTIEECRSQIVQNEESITNPNVQAVADDLKSQLESDDCVAIRDLAKTFHTSMGSKVAVQDLNLTFYKGQITALLGHNGAGKTTTISMLTGMIPVTSGHAFIQGRDIGSELKAIRQNLGVCPQHDILYPDLTVKEHLWLFANFKGVPYSMIDKKVDEMIVEVGLTEKKNARSKNLSGGQKRKLSVGISFIGDSKVVFLDEPTSGMDPYSRRFTWDVIRRNREGRVIVLTTHFMDEADLLGDRIAIMSDGSLRCCGSSLFLKNRFGVGYNLTLVKKMKSSNSQAVLNPVFQQEDEEKSTPPTDFTPSNLSLCDEAAVLKLITDFVPSQKLLSNVGAEMSFQLPQEVSKDFKPMLNKLDAQLKTLGVESYGISMTTLEEVFIRVAEGLHEEGAQDQINSIRQRALSKDSSVPAPTPATDEWKQRRLVGAHLFAVHIMMLLWKRFLAFKRDGRAALISIGAPVIFVLIGFSILSIQVKPIQPSHTLNLMTEYNSGISSTQNPVYYSANCTGTVCPFLNQLMAAIPGATPVWVPMTPDPTVSMEYQVNNALLNSMSQYKASRYGAYSFLSAETRT